MDSQSIHPLRRFSPAEPDLVSATEAFKKLNHFMSVLPASLKKKIDEEIHWHVGAQLPFDSWFFGPNCIAIDANRFDGAVDDITLASFYEKVGMFLTKDMEGEKEFKKKRFAELFASTALRRYRNNSNELPAVSIPSPTHLFLRLLWEDSPEPVEIGKRWQEAKATANARDRYKILRNGGHLLRTPAADFFGNLALETLRIFRQFEWEIDATLQGESDPVTLRNRTTFRMQGIWKKWELGGKEANGDSWVLHPRAAMEARIASPAMESDLLFLGGWQIVALNSQNGMLDFSPQTGFSTKKLLFFGQAAPGAEIAANWTQKLGETDWIKYWQASAVVQIGFAHQQEPSATVLGLVFKWVL